jgi:hypothetical protein
MLASNRIRYFRHASYLKLPCPDSVMSHTALLIRRILSFVALGTCARLFQPLRIGEAFDTGLP